MTTSRDDVDSLDPIAKAQKKKIGEVTDYEM